MAKLFFNLPPTLTQEGTLDLPAEVRTPNLGLVRRTLTSNAVDLQPGKYIVTADAPGGKTLFGEVEMGHNDTTIHFENEEQRSDDISSNFLESQAFAPLFNDLLQSPPTMAEDDAQREESQRRTSLAEKFFAIKIDLRDNVPKYLDPLSTAKPVSAMPEIQIDGNVIRFTATATFSLPWLCLRGPDTNLAVALPLSEGQSCVVELTWMKRSTQPWPNYLCHPSIHFKDSVKELMLRGLDRGHLAGAETAVDATMKLQEKNYRNQQFEDPIAVAMRSYSLLQCNDLERLHGWTVRLMEEFPWLPDANAIYGEHLALTGDHDGALSVFAKLERRVPVFSDGLSYVVQRLKLYSKLKDKRTLRAANGKSLKALLKSYEHVCASVDFSKVVVTRVITPQASQSVLRHRSF